MPAPELRIFTSCSRNPRSSSTTTTDLAIYMDCNSSPTAASRRAAIRRLDFRIFLTPEVAGCAREALDSNQIQDMKKVPLGGILKSGDGGRWAVRLVILAFVRAVALVTEENRFTSNFS